MKKITAGKILRIVGNVLTFLVLALAVTVAAVTFTAKSRGETPVLFGRSYHLVVSGSMEPEIAVGELVVSRKIAYADVEVGDNIVFLCVDPSLAVYGKEVIHKVVAVTADGIVTKGVANAEQDAMPVTAENLRGVAVAYSVFWGSVLLFLSNPINWLFLLLLAVLGWVIVRLTRSIIRQVKASPRPASAAGTDETEAQRAELEAEIRAQYGLPPAENAPDKKAADENDSSESDMADVDRKIMPDKKAADENDSSESDTADVDRKSESAPKKRGQ